MSADVMSMFPLCSPGGSAIRWSFALSGSGKESFNPILDLDADPDHHQNLITFKVGPSPTLLKISAKSGKHSTLKDLILSHLF